MRYPITSDNEDLMLKPYIEVEEMQESYQDDICDDSFYSEVSSELGQNLY